MRALGWLWLTLFSAALAAGAAADEHPSLDRAMPPKPPADQPPGPEVPRAMGDTVENPYVVPGLPFAVTGSTCGFNHDYDHACPFTGSYARDVVFAYDAIGSFPVRIDLCGSTYDTKVYVFENTVGNVIACNDDYCAWQSYLRDVYVTAGNTYYIVVDGYGGACGQYELRLSLSEPCVVECPPGAMPEGETDCYPDYNDTYNGGCNVVPFPVFQVLEPGCGDIVICGTTGVFPYGSSIYRDTDWFEIQTTEVTQICLAGDSEVPSYFFVKAGFGCEHMSVEAYGTPGPCNPKSDICFLAEPHPWPYWLIVVPQAWDLSFECGSVYWMRISGYVGGSSPAEHTTWGGVKGLFR